MCGIAGIVDPSHVLGVSRMKVTLDKMNSSLANRGPDQQGVWMTTDAVVGLAHRRLSILDLSEAGHQPMVSASKRFVLVYNGEIYNFRELRKELESRGYSFRGNSDTEVVGAGIQEWGLVSAVQRFVGMFAFAVYDKELRRLTLVRDRVGIKPLYYGFVGGGVVFASELKALRQHPAWIGDIDLNGLRSYLRNGYVSTPLSIHRNVFQLQPGCYVSFETTGKIDNSYSPWADESGVGLGAPTRYWSLRSAACSGRSSCRRTADEATEALESALEESVAARMVSDVPIGAFLSGGIDSSVVTALMQKHAEEPVKTFSIGFKEPKYNEAHHANAVAKHLGTEHQEFIVSHDRVPELITKMSSIFDEPFADSSAVPTYLVSQFARSAVTVALSGDGGDELFGGYSRYIAMIKVWQRLQRIGGQPRRMLAKVMRASGAAAWSPRMGKFAECLRARDAEEFYIRAFSMWPNASEMVNGSIDSRLGLDQLCPSESAIEKMTFHDMLSYLPDDILTKVDRTSMACGLEVRVPLLDHRVVEHVWTLPAAQRFSPSKGLLRRILWKYLPPALLDRPKMGFGIPISEWLRGPLHEWANDIWRCTALRDLGYVDWRPIDRRWRQFSRGNDYGLGGIWAILMLGQWLQDQRGRSS